MTFLAANKNGNQFVKARNGQPVWYATWKRNEAHEFATREEANDYAQKQFGGKGTVVEITIEKQPELTETEGARMVRYDGAWMSEEERSMWEQHNL